LIRTGGSFATGVSVFLVGNAGDASGTYLLVQDEHATLDRTPAARGGLVNQW
jgi:hypothetical protein